MNLNREILRLAVPSILANLTVPLVGMVDVAIAGHIEGGWGAATLIGGISVGSMLFDLLYWSFGFLRTGTGGLTAQAYGSAAPSGGILRRALRIALLSGLGLILLQWALLEVAFLFIPCSSEVRALAEQYFRIRIWAAPATLSLFAFKGWFIGMQDSVRPMTADILVNGLNIAASLVLALGVPSLGFSGMGFGGVALGTVVAQWAGFGYCAVALLCRYRGALRKPSAGVSDGAGAAAGTRFFRLNRDLFLRSVGMIAVYIGFTALSSGLGDEMLAVATILMKFLMIFSYFTDGFAYAGEALTGRFIGEGSADGVRSTVRQTFAWSAGVAALFMLLYGAGGVPMFRLMTTDAAVIDAGRQFLPWLLLMPPIGCAAFLWDGIYIGATASKDLRNSTLLCAAGFFAVWFAGIGFTHTPSAAIHLLMGAYFVHLAVRTVYLTLRARPVILRPLP
jgi:MATE family multidrug resistance protein